MAEFGKYREITSKLKKRFTLRKPNFREASESFKKLSTELADFKDYAGYCMLSAAQCEHNIVGSLREQQIGSSSGTVSLGGSLSSSPSSSATSPKPGSAVSASNLFSGGPSSGHGLERVLQSATLTEFQTWLDTARLFKEGDEVNGAIAAFAHSAQICPDKLLPVVYSEWAEMFRTRKRYFEAAEIYIEGGLLREAIDSLLAGQYFEDAYQCYQELFKLATKESSTITGISRSTSSVSAKSNLTPQITNKTSIPFFGRQKSSEPSKPSTTSGQANSLHQPPVRSDGGPFSDTDHLTIDDYITVFLLRLYLYDPVKYEYPSPIIPLPSDLVQSNLNLKLTNRTNTEEEELEDSIDEQGLDQAISSSTSSASVSATGQSNLPRANQPHLDFRISESFLPFIDFLNCRFSERTISDLIELNMLLETLYLSYRNELRHTIDHDYANGGDDSSWSSSSSSTESDYEGDNSEVLVFQQAQNKIPTVANVEVCEVPNVLPIPVRRDSIDDDPPTTTTTTTTTKSSTSGSSSTFEKNDLDDIGLKLEQLALQFGSSSRGKKTLKNRSKRQSVDRGCPQQLQLCPPEEAEVDYSDLDRKVAFQQRMLATEGDHDQQLRAQIACKLFPLLNSHQNQLVYLILKNKD